MPKKVMARLTVRRVLEIIDSTVESWTREQGTESDVAARVRTQLDKSAEAITYNAIGISRDTFGRVDIDTRSAGYMILKGKLEVVAKKWIEEHFDSVSPQLSTTEISDLKRHAAREYDKTLRKELVSLVETLAKADARAIVDRVGFSTDKMREELEDLIKEEDQSEAAEEAARGREFMKRTKIKEAEVQGVVAYDGERLSELIQDPDATCWHVVHLQSVFGGAECHVLTNGKEWHPLDPHFTKEGIECANSAVLETFKSSKQMIFNFLDESDRLFIANAIGAHYHKNNGSDDGVEIPF